MSQTAGLALDISKERIKAKRYDSVKEMMKDLLAVAGIINWGNRKMQLGFYKNSLIGLSTQRVPIISFRKLKLSSSL